MELAGNPGHIHIHDIYVIYIIYSIYCTGEAIVCFLTSKMIYLLFRSTDG